MGLPVEVNNLMMGAVGGYQISRSLRFRSSASAYLNRTPASASNQKIWTWSGWVKRGVLSVEYGLYQAYTGSVGTQETVIEFQSDNTLRIADSIAGVSTNWDVITTAVYRDPSAWYHILYAVDTTQATASNRVKLYVNGVQITSFGTATYPSLNFNTAVNTTIPHYICRRGSAYFDGYLAEVNFIDGQALTPSSFGAYDTNGVWQPKKYTGTYGTNGFYLPFSNTTSTTTLVQDSSGNGNNWTHNNISLTAGTTYDSMIDSPTVGASASNYCVGNPLYNDTAATSTWTNANLSYSVGNGGSADTTMAVSSGKWYWENTIGATSNGVGVHQAGSVGRFVNSIIYQNTGDKVVAGTTTAYGATYTNGDVIGVALDIGGGTVTFYKNNASQGSIALSGASITNASAFYSGGGGVSNVGNANFGQRPFSYTPPSGYVALNTANLPTPSITNGAQYMAATTYTGNGSTQSVSNGGNNTLGTTFAPDFVWVKYRNQAYNNDLFDTLRGVSKYLRSNSTTAELSYPGYGVTAFNSNGFSVTDDSVGNYEVNGSSGSIVAWNWKAGGTGVTNNSGTITSTVSANPTAGFSIVTYTGTGANATVGHGLGVAPSMIIIKSRTNGTYGWAVGHVGQTSWAYTTNLQSTSAQGSNPGAFNSTAPTSSVFSVGTNADTNGSTLPFVAYCFAAVSGYSAFGSYTGNGSTDGTFIFTNFRPRWILIKRTDSIDSWYIYDSSRNTYNVMNSLLIANLSNAESTAAVIDFLSNGFKIRDTGGGFNASGGTYVYACFSENPFKYSRGR